MKAKWKQTQIIAGVPSREEYSCNVCDNHCRVIVEYDEDPTLEDCKFTKSDKNEVATAA